ncbi:MAG: metallophosphoesterase [Candidatus Micrarchaeota archaeon]|nr:metallophosphoesterase [Candidatus Micrarchaeota archaeon]MCX8154786.1 metallophosphoesterase [Candidatus Micrarchaeota archaeon]
MKIRDITLDPSGAAVLGKYLLVADLHIGIENSLGLRKGVNTDPILKNLEILSSKHDTDTLVIIGDLKHTFNFRDIDLVRGFIRRSKEIFSEIFVIQGNHDTGIDLLTKDINVQESLEYKDYVIVHGHKSVDRGGFIIMGHEHPVIDLSNRFRSSRYICFLEFEDVLLLPAFNNVSPGNDVLSSKFSSEILNSRDRWNAILYVSDGMDVFRLGRLGDVAIRIYGEIPEI